MKARRAQPRLMEWLITLPSFAWLLVFFAIPTLIIFLIMLRPTTPMGDIGAGWSLQALEDMANPSYPRIYWRTIWLSVVTTVLCVALAVPVAYAMARAPRRWRNVLLMLVIVPFWTNFLIRVFAWKTLLHAEGPIKRALASLGVVAPNATLLNNDGAVLLVMVYMHLPFAILPLYAASEKFDFGLLEAASDLGCRAFQAFRSIFLPGVERGLWTAALMVFVPALGAYVIPDFVGGVSSEMIGSRIARRALGDRNLPHAAALAAVLAFMVIIPLGLGHLFRRRLEGKQGTP